jgi:hypothetical protein
MELRVKKTCKSCQTEIDAKATKCPNCKSDQRNWFMKHKIMSVLGALIVIAILGSALGGNKDKTASNTGASSTPTPAPTVVDTKAFADEFNANQVAAENKYKGKSVQLTATITNITDSGLSFQNVSSKEFDLTQIACNTTDKNQLVSVKNGQSVTVVGKVSGQTIGVIGLDDCSIVK